jgi:hypothetical protein
MADMTRAGRNVVGPAAPEPDWGNPRIGTATRLMRLTRAGLVYFVQVFGAGFALAFIRIPFLVPRFGVRAAELMEMPLMLAVILWASRRLAHGAPGLSRSARLGAGGLALLCLIGAELGVAYFVGARSPSEYISSRDAISGSVYSASLLLFAAAPAAWNIPPRA